MTAAINRLRPFVDSKGSLTQYGWSVMQSVWVAIGGATSSADSLNTDQFAVEPVSALMLPLAPESPGAPPVSAVLREAGDVAPVSVFVCSGADMAPVSVSAPNGGDVGPV